MSYEGEIKTQCWADKSSKPVSKGLLAMGGTCGAFPAVANKKEMIALFHFHFEERFSRASYYAIARACESWGPLFTIGRSKSDGVIPVNISPGCYWRSMTQLWIGDAILVGIDALSGRVRGAASASNYHFGLVFVTRFSFLAIQQQEVNDFFCNK